MACTVVLVTGASGFIAGHLVEQLLLKGYRVRATVRSIEDTAAYNHLVKLTNSENLEIVEANLTQEQSSWIKIGVDVEFVFHVASPFIMMPEDPENTLMKPVLEGMKSVLELCQQTKTVKKLILTSCIGSITDEFDSTRIYDETHWNDTSSLERNSYHFSKTEQEKLAWNYVKDPNCSFKLVSLLPGHVLGPHLNISRLSISHNIVLSFLTRARRIPNLSFAISDVRDVANAHILAIENNEVVGRYCFCNEAVHWSEMLQTIHEAFYDIKVPTGRVRDFVVRAAMARDTTPGKEFIQYNLSRVPRVECAKAKGVGMVMRPITRTIIDTVRFFVTGNWIEQYSQARNSSCRIL